MKKLLLVLLAFLAIFTYIRAIDSVEAKEILAVTPTETVEITQ
jgi:hypothetical protein